MFQTWPTSWLYPHGSVLCISIFFYGRSQTDDRVMWGSSNTLPWSPDVWIQMHVFTTSWKWSLCSCNQQQSCEALNFWWTQMLNKRQISDKWLSCSISLLLDFWIFWWFFDNFLGDGWYMTRNILEYLDDIAEQYGRLWANESGRPGPTPILCALIAVVRDSGWCCVRTGSSSQRYRYIDGRRRIWIYWWDLI